jgi:Flp pilus assembly secretin CpaC
MIIAKTQAKITARMASAVLASAFISYFNAVPAAANDDMLRVYMDQARILKLDRDVKKVIVGNADVADVTVADARTIVLTGRSYGATNLVLLDIGGNAILDERVIVAVDEANTLRVYKQTERSVLSCSPNCEQHADTSGTKSNNSSAVASAIYINPTEQVPTGDRPPVAASKPVY